MRRGREYFDGRVFLLDLGINPREFSETLVCLRAGKHFDGLDSKLPFVWRAVANDSVRGIALSISAIRCEPARQPL